MKKILCFLTLVCLFSSIDTTSYAQSRFGVKAGINLTRYVGDRTDDAKNLVGFQGGFSYTMPLTTDGFFAIQPELLYVQKGAKVPQNGREVTSRLHYLDLPVLARVKAGGLLLEAGPQFGYLLSHSGGYTADAPAAGYRRVDVGYVAGVGYAVSSRYTLELRYNGGLSRLFSSLQGGLANPRNSGFQLNLGYLFGE